jgi:TnpA family transposase
VLIYWHVDCGSVVIHSQRLNCSASEVHAMVDGAIRRGTETQVEANYVNTHGQSEIGFGITKLLGFDLLPRIKRIDKAKLYHPATGESGAWPGLAPALTRPIRWDRIAGPPPPCTSTQLAAPLIMNMRSFPGTRLSFPARHAQTS